VEDETGELNLLQEQNRKIILESIRSEDNFARKRDQQKRFDVYNDRQDIYILERLQREFSKKTVSEMRKILSINLSKRIIDEKSSVYNTPPKRVFHTLSGIELTEEQQLQCEHLYSVNKANFALKRSNIFFNTHDQCTIMVVPNNRGGLKIRAIPPHHYDVVPSSLDPEIAHAYILNVWDKDTHQTAKQNSSDFQNYRSNSSINMAIADDSDYKALMERYIVWTKDYYFIMDGKGNFKTEPLTNPIGILPFIDVAPPDKDFQFFIRRGSSTIDFSIDYGMMLSDNANVIRLQSYSQAVISSEKPPTNMTVGPNHILHLKLDPKKPELSPKFEFVTPSPDLSGTQAFLESLLNLHLTSEGQDPSILSSKEGSGQRFQSGLDRLLAMISKFEATKDDFEMYRDVEKQLLTIMSRWSNQFQDVIEPGQKWVDALTLSTLPEDITVDLKFNEPEAIQTKKDLEDSVIKLVQEGLMSRVEAIMDLRQVNRESAIEILRDIDEDAFGKADLSEEQG